MRTILKLISSGFFRTIGKIFAFLLIGFILLIIGLKFDIKLPRGLAWSVVYADEYTWLDLSSNTDYNGKLTMITQSNSTYNTNPNTLQSLSDTAKLKTLTNTLCSSNKTCTMSANKVYEVVWQLGDGTHDTFPSWLNLSNNWRISPTELFNNIKFDLRYYDNGIATSFSTIYQLSDNTDLLNDYFEDFKFDIEVSDNDSATIYFLLLRFVPKYDLRDFKMTLTMTSGNVYNQIKNFYYEIDTFRYSEGDYIPPVHDLLGGLADTIGYLVNDITDDISELSEDYVNVSWFTDYNLSSEFALSGLFSLPLDLINSIELQQFYDLCFELKGKNVCFPSGNILWNRTIKESPFGLGNITTFRSFFNLVIGGLLSWMSLKSLWKTLHQCINPVEDSSMEVMKL